MLGVLRQSEQGQGQGAQGQGQGVRGQGVQDRGVPSHGVQRDGVQGYGVKGHGVPSEGDQDQGEQDQGVQGQGVQDHGVPRYGEQEQGGQRYGVQGQLAGGAPGLSELDRLVAMTTDAGVHVEVRRLGERRPLPPEIDVSAYRIIQEAITNVVRHADTSRCRVSIDYRDDELAVEILDEGRGPRRRPEGGYGLVGMRERANLLRGASPRDRVPRAASWSRPACP